MCVCERERERESEKHFQNNGLALRIVNPYFLSVKLGVKITR